MKLKRFLLTFLSLSALGSMCISAAVVSGVVKDTDGNPIPGVKVSDGKTVVKTDQQGKYVMPTDKANLYVFDITPKGYEPASTLVNRPKFWQLLTADSTADENVDFILNKTDDSRYRFLALADIQLGRRINDVAAYQTKSVPDINATIAQTRESGLEPFIITLGDESWDSYWYRNGYALPELIADEERLDCRIYNVIGNHDHDPYIAGDDHASDTWRRLMGPNYYAFDKGAIHFVVLDNIDYINEGAEPGKEGKRNYNNTISQQQLDWLRAELADVDTGTPIVVAMHIPFYTPEGTYNLTNGATLNDILSAFSDVRIITGHTHYSYAVDSPDKKIKENNYGAVCGTWWATDQPDYGDNGVCRDGTPSGYAVWDVDGNNISGIYKGTGFPEDYQFRIYDGNTLDETEENAVIVNVWGWAPDWEISVLENGKPLQVRQVSYRDPLHIISSEKPHLAKGLKNPTMASTSEHFFKAVSKKANTPIEVVVKAREGRQYRQTMVRPKPLTTDMR